MLEGLLAGLGFGRRYTEKMRGAWTHDIKAEGEHVRHEIARELKHMRIEQEKLMRAEQEKWARALSAVQDSLAQAIERQHKAERRATQFILQHELDEKNHDLV